MAQSPFFDAPAPRDQVVRVLATTAHAWRLAGARPMRAFTRRAAKPHVTGLFFAI